ncbi:hypothetical protein FRY74_04075 [Vicingus serpentipes]|uniref:Outer membrane beta-barrel protein n=1 Tax=Vicingus serpentipes TaxID=1926625 RepID=A0A5C6RVZ6_9FLAO|nr:hypothetical protein [Vicingus serpentipes]TXB65750.1 hypothetical protein FRY74_04075 [Vicingus serpentipes]
MRLLLTLTILISASTFFGQEISSEATTQKRSNKGRFYGFWGWNSAWYTNSDIHFKGDDHDFTLYDVKAKDRQTPLGIDPYLNPSRLTIPQTNYRIGYYINDKYDISIGVDHMKYVMDQFQTVKIDGRIDIDNIYNGTYNNQDIIMSYDFLTFEHTDGLNYISIELTRNDDLLELLKIHSNPKKIQLNTLLGFGGGISYPKSNVRLINNLRNDEFHVAGYGFAAKGGLNLTFFKYVFLRSELKYGFINMPDIRTTPSASDKASQHFFFTQINYSIGFTLYPFSKSE